MRFHAAADEDQTRIVRMGLPLRNGEPVLTACGHLVPAKHITAMIPRYNELMERPGRFCRRCFPYEPEEDD